MFIWAIFYKGETHFLRVKKQLKFFYFCHLRE